MDITKITLSWYLRELVNAGTLHRLGRGLYTNKEISETEFIPHLRDKVIKVGKEIAKNFPLVNYSVFDGQVLSDFQQHHSTNNITYIEVERDAAEAIFHFFKQLNHKVYLNPDKDFVYDNIDLAKPGIILKHLVSESPLTECRGLKTPRLEKILVDILCDDDMDYLHGVEWSYIFRNALSRYAVNRTTMLRYASRRNVREAIQAAIDTIENHD